MMQAWLRAPVAVLILAVLVSSSDAQTVKLTVDFAIQGQQSPFVLAADNAQFAQPGLNLQVDRGYGSADAITKVASGAYDMGFADLGALIQFNGRQAGAKVISVLQIYDVAPMVILSLKKSNIAKPSDLAGKHIASPTGSSSRVMFPLFARANGLDPSAVNWIDVTPQLRETLLVQGRTDATTAFITDLAGLERLGMHESDVNVMRYSDFGVRVYGNCVLTTPEFAAKNPEAVKKVVKAAADAWKAAIADPGLAIAAIKKREPLIDEKVERGRLDLVIKNAVLTEDVKRGGLGAIDPVRLKQTIEMVTSTFGLPALEPSSVYRPNYLPPQSELRLQQ
jgi:NitT/TauT family transport system substrate-binding protein